MPLTRRALAAHAIAAHAIAASVITASRRAAAEDAPTLVVGGMLETSGFLATLGSQGLEGAQLATDELNAAGKAPKVKLVNFNSESDESKAVTVARRLIEREEVAAIIGAMNSGANLAILDVVQRAGVPLLSNGASRAIVSPARERKWVFQVPLSDLLAIRTTMAFMRARGIAKVAVIAADSAYGTSGVKTWNDEAKDGGITVVATQTYGNLDQDMTPQLTLLRGSGADAVVLWATGPGQSIAIRNYRQLGLTAPLFGSPGTADPNVIKLAGAAANGILFPASKLYVADSLPDSDPEKAVITAFSKAFVARHGRPPSPFAGYGYDAVRMLHAAAASGTGREKLRDGVEGLKDWPAVSGIYAYSPDDHLGLVSGSAAVQTITDGAFALPKA